MQSISRNKKPYEPHVSVKREKQLNERKNVKLFKSVCLALALDVTATSFAIAQNFEKGLEAYDTVDFTTALQNWRLLAEQGDVHAQYNLGWLYQQRDGVPQDYAEAISWYRKAAEQGFAWAQNNLGLMYEQGVGIPQDYAVAHMWYNLADANGLEDAADYRDNVAKQMTPQDISRAQALASECLNSNYENCG